MAATLIKFLSNLIGGDTEYTIFVNPNNYDDYCIERASVHNNHVPIGNTRDLGFLGHQSKVEGLRYYLYDCQGHITVGGQNMVVDVESVVLAYSTYIDNLHPLLKDFCEDKAARITKKWAIAEAENYVLNVLPEYMNEYGRLTKELQEMV